jgi:hypothetical protein
MVHLGFNVYLAHQSRQNRFLVDCLSPAVEEVRRGWPGTRFWFSRFDARGPHLFVVISANRQDTPVLVECISDRLTTYLAQQRGGEHMSQEEVEERHAACRGKSLCAVDREAGLAEEGTFRSFGHPIDGYPFFLMTGAAEDGIPELLSEQSLWSIQELAKVAPRNAVASSLHWLAEVDRQLALRHREAGDYWRYHLGTLLPHLAEKLADQDSKVQDSLVKAVGRTNERNFERIWAESEEARSVWPGIAQLVERATGESCLTSQPRWALLREIVHTTLLQLGLAVALQIPPLVFCWHKRR